jgi:hypothetical protein
MYIVDYCFFFDPVAHSGVSQSMVLLANVCFMNQPTPLIMILAELKALVSALGPFPTNNFP